MSFEATVFRVMIASPGDVQAEREAATEEVFDWNSINAVSRGIVLLPVKWETDTTPQYGTSPQVLINKQILEDSDILIGIFGCRLGTPTIEYPSGTAEEIARHAGSGKTVKLYFSNAPLPRDFDLAQYTALTNYRQASQMQGLNTSYSDVADFRHQFRRHLDLELNDLRYRPNTIAHPTVATPPVVAVPVLSEAAIEMLNKAVAAGGDILAAQMAGLSLIATGGEQFGKGDDSPITAARWKAAFDELTNQGFVEHVSGSTHRVTYAGYGYVQPLGVSSNLR